MIASVGDGDVDFRAARHAPRIVELVGRVTGAAEQKAEFARLAVDLNAMIVFVGDDYLILSDANRCARVLVTISARSYLPAYSCISRPNDSIDPARCRTCQTLLESRRPARKSKHQRVPFEDDAIVGSLVCDCCCDRQRECSHFDRSKLPN